MFIPTDVGYSLRLAVVFTRMTGQTPAIRVLPSAPFAIYLTNGLLSDTLKITQVFTTLSKSLRGSATLGGNVNENCYFDLHHNIFLGDDISYRICWCCSRSCTLS